MLPLVFKNRLAGNSGFKSRSEADETVIVAHLVKSQHGRNPLDFSGASHR